MEKVWTIQERLCMGVMCAVTVALVCATGFVISQLCGGK